MLSPRFVAYALVALSSCSAPNDNGDAARGSDAGGDTATSMDATIDPDAAAANDVTAATDGAPNGISGRVVFDKYNGQRNIPSRSDQIGIVDGASTLTDDNGNYAVPAEPNVDLLLRAPLPGEISVQRALRLPSSNARVDLHVIDIDAYVGTVSRLGGDIDAFSFGMVAVRFRGATQPGYTATISASHGGAFVYTPPDAFGTAVASDTTRAADDSIYFYAVAPGTATLSTTAPPGAAPCVDPFAPSTRVYPITAGTFTEIVLECP